MKINSRMLSIPPYISTNWENVRTLTMNGSDLIVRLTDNNAVVVPNLPGSILEDIFQAHTDFLEHATAPAGPALSRQMGFQIGMNPLNLGKEGIEMLSGSMQHDPSLKDAPEIPPPVIDKVKTVIRSLGVDKLEDMLPKAEPHCNCPYCQIARAVHGTPPPGGVPELEEKVSDEELSFKDWEIRQIDDKLYQLTSPLDPKETYQVFLGNPIGCTCGKSNCEHIKCVLSS
ncbi:MAG: hypothetical protein A3F09_04010 [Chlamydiae bacterium RIFCSPHIGHO2_12_FULL_49_11]|nr:MAG: hypothetical protein A3F09_04010 [Chlamydiae bacterium RIFCSPHIGHO2_12_FULL_49_11]